MGFNPFTKSFWNGVGDKVAGTVTLGHCDHSGCSSGDRQEQLAAEAQQREQEQQQKEMQQTIEQIQEQVRRLLMLGLVLVAAFVGLDLLLDVIFWLVDFIF